MDTWVYFVRAGVRGPIKIGHAKDPISRLRGLQTASPYPLTLLGTVRGGEPIEKKLHEHLAADRLLGEWFQPTEHVLALVNGLLLAEAMRLKGAAVALREWVPIATEVAA
jgi:hypothetical protein